MKVLICITPQGNSKRLIDKGFELLGESGEEAHILYIQKGCGVFEREETAELLQSLFDYGAEKGGVVHALCGDDIAEAIKSFVRKWHITDIVLGAKDTLLPSENVYDKLRRRLPKVKITVLEHENV